MIPKIILMLTGAGIAGDSVIALLHGDIVSGGTALAMVIIYFALLRRIDGANAKINVLATKFSTDIEDIKKHLDQISRTVVRVD